MVDSPSAIAELKKRPERASWSELWLFITIILSISMVWT